MQKPFFMIFGGRVLEIGSKDYANTQPFRELFANPEYVGVDLDAGKNVEFVVDLEQGLGPRAGQKFDLIVICPVLEHSPRPGVLAENIQTVLAENGALMSCHPWVWRYHKYPDDYFRFSPKGIMALFPELKFWLPMFYASYKRAAAQGDATAQVNLGGMYYKGKGVVKDYAEAMRWYKLAAAQGDAYAQYNLGVMYRKGEGS